MFFTDHPTQNKRLPSTCVNMTTWLVTENVPHVESNLQTCLACKAGNQGLSRKYLPIKQPFIFKGMHKNTSIVFCNVPVCSRQHLAYI